MPKAKANSLLNILFLAAFGVFIFSLILVPPGIEYFAYCSNGTNGTDSGPAETTQTTLDSSRAVTRNVANILRGRVLSVLAPRPAAMQGGASDTSKGKSPPFLPEPEATGPSRDLRTDTRSPEEFYAEIVPAAVEEEQQAPAEETGFETKRWGIWGLGGLTWLEDDQRSTEYDGYQTAGMFGADMRVYDNLLIGLAGGYEGLDLDTDFNDGRLDNDGLTAMAYGSFALTETTIIDASFGSTWLGYDRERRAGISGEHDSLRTMTNAGITQYYIKDNLVLSGNLSFMYMDESQDSYTESNDNEVDEQTIYLAEWTLNARAAYYYKDFEPYLQCSYIVDTALTGHADNPDRDEWELSGGLTYYATDSFFLGLEGGKSFGREHSSASRVMLSLRFEF